MEIGKTSFSLCVKTRHWTTLMDHLSIFILNSVPNIKDIVLLKQPKYIICILNKSIRFDGTLNYIKVKSVCVVVSPTQDKCVIS